MMDTSVNFFSPGNSDASIMNSSVAMSKEEFTASLVPKVQAILDARFPNDAAKRKIRIYRDRISFAAPCCGDSAHDRNKKRGNIILEGKFKNSYKCFNCGVFMSLPNFFKQYGTQLDLSEINYITTNKSAADSYINRAVMNSVNYLYDTEVISQYAVDRETFKSILGLEECKNNFGERYLRGRMQYDTSKFLYSSRANKLFLLNLTPDNKILGIQVRHFDNKSAKYKTFNLQKIHEIILRDNVEVPDDINDLSMLFNILLVDCNRIVTITEGPMDAFLLKNAVALCGAGKNVDFPFDHRFLFDGDKTGREHAIESLKEGNYVFMWSKYIKENGLPNRSKWDINDVVKFATETGARIDSIDGYFTNDRLDTIYL